MPKYDLKENINIEEVDKLFKQAIETIEKYKSSLDQLTKAVKQNGKATEEINEASKEKKKVLTDIEKIEKQNEKTVKKILLAETEQNKELQKSKIRLQEKNKEIRESIKEENERVKSLTRAEKALKNEVKTIREAEKQNKALRVAVKNIDTTTNEGLKTLQRYNKVIEDNTEYIKENSDQGIQQKMTIGDYKDQVKEAIIEVNAFSSSMGGFTETAAPFVNILKMMGKDAINTGKSFKTASSGSQIFSSSMRILNLIIGANVIGILVLALASVVTYFKATTEGAKELDKYLKIISGTIDIAVSKIASFGKGVKEWITGTKDLGDAWDDFSNELDKTGDQFDKVVESAEGIVNLESDVKALQRSTELLNSELDKSIVYYQTMADDATISLKQQEEAQRKALDLEIQKSNNILALAQKELEAKQSILDLQEQIDTSTVKYREALEEVEQAQIRLREAETEAYNTQYEASKNLRQIRQDEGEQRLDYLIDFYDNQKTINERIISDDTRTFEERQKILDETVKAGDKSFKEQISLLQEYTKEKIDSNKLINESDSFTAYEYAKSLGLSEVLTNRLLEVIRERKTATQDLFEVQKDLNDEQIKANKEAQKQAKLDEANILKDRLAIVQEGYNQEQKLLVDKLANSEITYEEYNKRLIDLTKNRTSSELETLIKYYDEQIESLGGFYELSLEAQEQYLEAKEELNKKEEEAEENKFSKFTELAQNYKNVATGIGQAILDRKKVQIDAELDYLNEKANTEEGLTQAEEKRQKELARQKAEIVRKEAILNKTSALIDIAINTASAITQALPNLFLAGAVGALGVAQAGIVLAQPLPSIPQFATGIDKAPRGFKIMGEEGREALEDQSGNLLGFTEDHATLYNDLGGYKVLNAKDTSKKYKNDVDKYSKSSNDYLKKISKKKTVININIPKQRNYSKSLR